MILNIFLAIALMIVSFTGLFGMKKVYEKAYNEGIAEGRMQILEENLIRLENENGR